MYLLNIYISECLFLKIELLRNLQQYSKQIHIVSFLLKGALEKGQTDYRAVTCSLVLTSACLSSPPNYFSHLCFTLWKSSLEYWCNPLVLIHPLPFPSRIKISPRIFLPLIPPSLNIILLSNSLPYNCAILYLSVTLSLLSIDTIQHSSDLIPISILTVPNILPVKVVEIEHKVGFELFSDIIILSLDFLPQSMLPLPKFPNIINQQRLRFDGLLIPAQQLIQQLRLYMFWLPRDRFQVIEDKVMGLLLCLSRGN